MPDLTAQIRAAMDRAASGHVDAAIDSLRRLVQRYPRDPHAAHYLGLALMRAGRLDEAAFHLLHSLDLGPSIPAMLTNAAAALALLGRDAQAAELCHRALRDDPRHVPALIWLARTCVNRLDFAAAIASASQAVALAPDRGEAHVALWAALLQSGRVDDALAAVEQALPRHPHYVPLLAARATTLNYLSSVSESDVLAAHRALGEAIESQAVPPLPPSAARPDPQRPLRVAYLSPDFRNHAVAPFIESLLAHHDRRRFHIVCVYVHHRADTTTARLKALSDTWVDAAGMDDAALARHLHALQPHILIDLAGHSVGARPGVLARRPAPLQLHYLGYPNTLGLRTLDARIADHITDPPNEPPSVDAAPPGAVVPETIARLERCFLAWTPPSHTPPPRHAADSEAEAASGPASAPAAAVVFGSFNTLAKLSDATLDVWAAILAAAPGSRLRLKAWALGSAEACTHLRGRLAARGVQSERIECLGHVPSLYEHLDQYRVVDVALDPFPYNGTATTCEALWMGVPVITLRGQAHRARVGASLLSAAGLDHLIADSPQAYVRLALELAQNVAGLRTRRAELRQQIGRSPLTNASALAQAFEHLLHTLWRRRCARIDEGGSP